MSIKVVGRHVEISEAISQRITERIEEMMAKYFGGTFNAQVTITKEGSSFHAEFLAHLSSGVTLQAHGESGDAYSAVDVAAEHLGKRMRRYKRRLKDHGHGIKSQVDAMMSYVLTAPDDEEEEANYSEEVEAGQSGELFEPVVIAEEMVNLSRISTAEAVAQLDLTGAPVVVFKQPKSGAVNVVFRRSDGHIGWIDTNEAAKN